MFLKFDIFITQSEDIILSSAREDIDVVMVMGMSPDNMYGLLTKREVKMTGYWPSSFFACLWTETKSRSINTQKKNEANIQSS